MSLQKFKNTLIKQPDLNMGAIIKGSMTVTSHQCPPYITHPCSLG